MGPDIGALIGEEADVQAEDEAPRVHGRPQTVALVAGMVGGHHVLAPVLDPADGPPQAQGRRADEHVLRVDLAPDAEAAADMALTEVELGGVAAEHPRDGVPVVMHDLGGAVQGEHVVLAEDGHRSARLHRDAGMTADGDVEFDHRMGLREGSPRCPRSPCAGRPAP